MIELLSSGKLTATSPDANLPHVLLVVDQFPKNLGGGERIALRLASLLPGYGYRVSILTFFVHAESRVQSLASCPLYVLPLGRTYDWTALKAALRLRRFVRDQKVRIVQTFFESSDIWAGTVTRLFSDTRLIWSRRDLGILRARKHRTAYRALAGLPDAVFAVSDEVRNYCIQTDRIRPQKVHTIYNGLDLPPFAPMEKSMDRPLIVTVGNIRRVKGHDVLAQAAAIVLQSFPEARFSIAGEVLEQDYFGELQELIGKLGLSGKLHFPGNVTDLYSYLSAADIFVLPSRSEGFSNALIEAMAAGLPAVATDVGGNAEAISEGVNGFLVPPEDPEQLAEAIMKLIANPQLAKNMGQSGRSTVLDRFSTESMMRKTVDVYGQLLSRKM